MVNFPPESQYISVKERRAYRFYNSKNKITTFPSKIFVKARIKTQTSEGRKTGVYWGESRDYKNLEQNQTEQLESAITNCLYKHFYRYQISTKTGNLLALDVTIIDYRIKTILPKSYSARTIKRRGRSYVAIRDERGRFKKLSRTNRLTEPEIELAILGVGGRRREQFS